MRFLRAHECDEMQGFYFSKPLPEHEFFLLVQNSITAGACAFAGRTDSITVPLPPLDPAL